MVTATGEVIALDAKINFDDNALYRHPEVAAMRDPDEEDPKETQAKEYDLSYIALDGNIGCMVNGAGLAMATMDVIQLAGGRPANFLDVGGGADEEKVTAAFKIILSGPEREGGAGQHLRRHHEVRRHRQRHRGRGPAGRALDAAGGPPRGHQRRAGQGDPGQERARHHRRRRPRRRRPEGRGGGPVCRRPRRGGTP